MVAIAVQLVQNHERWKSWNQLRPVLELGEDPWAVEIQNRRVVQIQGMFLHAKNIVPGRPEKERSGPLGC